MSDMQRTTYCEAAMGLLNLTSQPEWARIVDCAIGLANAETLECWSLDRLLDYIDAHGGGGGGGNCYIETGQYTGDGAVSMVVNLTDASLAVKWIFIAPDSAGGTQVNYSDGIDQMGAGKSGFMSTGGASNYSMYADGIIAYGTGSFTVDDGGGDFVPNKNGEVYNYVVIGTH